MRHAKPSAAGASAALLVLLLGGCASSAHYFRDAGTPPPPAAVSLQTWPHREIWTGVVFNGEKIGFTRRALRRVAEAGEGYEIESEAVMRIRFLGIDKRINLRALDRVRADLTLESFRYEHEIDGSPLKVAGASDGRQLRFSVEASGSREDKSLVLEESLYASSALAFLPAIRGLAVGRGQRYLVFHGETQTVVEAEQRVLAYEASELFKGAAFKVQTRLLGLETTTWVAPDGRPLFELGLRGVLISALEEEASARRYLLEASFNRNDALLDFSLLRAGPVEDPRRVSRLQIELEGLPAGFAAPSDGGQSCASHGDRLRCLIDRAAPLAQGDPQKYLRPSLAAPSTLAEVSGLARQIAGGATQEDEKIDRLLLWMDANIAKEAVDAFSALDVLRSRRAECQGHAYLFAAFARALGIPTRIVNGLAYSEAHGGFLYHSWNEAWIAGRGWRPVDPTFGQPHADATHVKLLEGESAADLAPLAGLVGRLRVGAVAALARW